MSLIYLTKSTTRLKRQSLTQLYVLGGEFGFPLRKRVGPADVKANVIKHRRFTS